MTNEIIPYDSSAENVVVYRTDDNSIQLQVKLEQESVWLTQDQMAMLFQRDKTVITRHVNNIYAEGELDRESTSAKFAFVPATRERQYVYHCGHSVKDLGKKLSAIMKMDLNPEVILKELR